MNVADCLWSGNPFNGGVQKIATESVEYLLADLAIIKWNTTEFSLDII